MTSDRLDLSRYVGNRPLIRIFDYFYSGLSDVLRERLTKIAFVYLIFLLLIGLFGGAIAPYEHDERMRGEDGQLIRSEGPSVEHPLGTTDSGYDVLSRVLVGAQPTVIAGLLGGTLIVSIGLFVGLVSGYMGGRVDDILMRATDMMYGIPVIPFSLVLIAVLGTGFYQSILVIGLIIWRGNARVLRSQTLQIRERPFVQSAIAVGASTPRIIYSHIFPLVLPMAVLFFALGTGYTILLQAGLAFLGVTDPFVPSWGIMIRNAYESGTMTLTWWWALAPGLLISFTVLSLFLFGRGYENAAGVEEGDEAMAAAG